MKHHIGKACLITLSILFAAGASLANVQKTDATAKPVTSSAKAANAGKSGKADKAKAAGKWVDINSASKAELKTLPGIDDALANKIIAGRPYKSKAFLITNKIIPPGAYQAIRDQVIAKQK